MKIKVKKQYQVGGHIYAIALDPDLEKQDDLGVVDHTGQRIYINPTRPKSQMLEALLHELIHVVNVVFTHHELGESHVGGLAQGFLQLLGQHEIEFDWSDIPYKSNALLPPYIGE